MHYIVEHGKYGTLQNSCSRIFANTHERSKNMVKLFSFTYLFPFHFSAVPLEPENIQVFGIDSDELSVRWQPPEDADSFGIQTYVVQHRKFSDKVFTNFSESAAEDKKQYTYRIKALEPETTYMVRVGSVNKYGDNFNDESGHKTDAARKSSFFMIRF